MKIDEDIKLMLKAKKDNLDAFEQLYNKYSRVIGNFYLRLGCTQETSQDNVQEVFMRLWRARYNYEPRAKFTTYLFQIAKNFWINEYEKKKRRPKLQSIDRHPQIQNVEKKSPLPDKEMMSKELSDKILQCVQQLDEKYRLVFVMSQFQDLKYREIAEIMNIPLGTVKSRMSSAEKILREKLTRFINQ